MNYNKFMGNEAKKRQRSYEKQLVISEIQKEIKIKEQEQERKRTVQKELMAFYDMNSKTCYENRGYKREMANILREQLKSRR